ncbi:hypothetical protein J6590_044094 [Homalodisca vitripennis]|nr:hypothetical protein J6590_044094 [Homalodisca vitripennis]
MGYGCIESVDNNTTVTLRILRTLPSERPHKDERRGAVTLAYSSPAVKRKPGDAFSVRWIRWSSVKPTAQRQHRLHDHLLTQLGSTVGNDSVVITSLSMPGKQRSLEGNSPALPGLAALERLGLERLERTDCEKRAFCELAVLGSQPRASGAQQGLWKLANR